MRSTVSLSILTAFCSMAAWAQSGPPPVLQIARELTKEGRAAAHEKVESDWARAMRRAKVPYHYVTLSAMTGTGELWFLTAFPSFDAVGEMVKEFEKPPLKTEMETLDSRDGELRANSRTMYAVLLKDLSYQPEKMSVAKARYFTITTMRVRMGHMDQFMSGSKVFADAYQKSNQPVSYAIYRVIAGAPEGLILIVEPMESMKALDTMPQREEAVRKAMGMETFGKMMKGTADVFSSIETSLFSVNPRMSYVSKTIEDADPEFWRPKPAATKPAADSKPKEKAGGN